MTTFWIDEQVKSTVTAQGLVKGRTYRVLEVNIRPTTPGDRLITYDLVDAEDNVLRDIFAGDLLLTRVA